MELIKLMETVDIQIALLNELLTVLERETAEMGDSNVSAMSVTNHDKEDLIRKISDHAPLLVKSLSDMAVRRGLAADATFTTLAEHLNKAGNRELLIKQQLLKSAADRIQQVAALNREIAERFASTIATTLTLITRLVNQSNVYGSSGGYQQRRTGAVMINMEA